MERSLFSRLRLSLAGALALAAIGAIGLADGRSPTTAADGPSAAAAERAVIQARLTEETLPAEEMPPTPAESATPAAATGSPKASPSVQAGAAPTTSPAPTETRAAEAGTPTVQPTPGAQAESGPTSQPETEPTAPATPDDMPPPDLAPLDVGTVEPQLRISDSSLDAAIHDAASPSMAASLRVVDQARQNILDNQPGDAIELLARALSIDGTDSYAYFYLGRAWLAKKDYAQAMTFLKRAEIGLGSNPKWLSETLAFEGLTYEDSGNAAAAEAAYQFALKAEPGNLMARAGYTRLATAAAESAGAPPVSDVVPPPEESPPAAPPSEGSAAKPAAPEEPPAAPPAEVPPAEAPAAN